MHDTPGIIELDYGISAIDTEYLRPLMDASHLIVADGRAAFVDTGTTRSVPNLLAALTHLGLDVADVDYVFLTHVHLDHAGGAGELMRHLPAATAVLHPRGAPHMIDPQKLVAGSIQVYGEQLFAQLYDRIVPIPQERVQTVADGERITLGTRTFEFIHTAGHALHHYCIIDEAHRGVFSGDSFGISYRETDTGAGAFIFPTTTPTQFDPVAAHASYDRIVSYHPRYVYLTHYSRVTQIEDLARDLHRRLDAYVDIARRNVAADDRPMRIAAELREYLNVELIEHGYDGDEDARAVILDPEVELNAQGLDVWLHRLRKNGQI